MTPRQVELARHALGLDGHKKVSYRNRFIAPPETPDFSEWDAMVAAGYAKRLQRSAGTWGYGIGVLFWLTRAGAELVLRPGESLCPEDFPASPTTLSAE
ncbi:hypothetical protein [Azospirillum sp.]|uniref:hypothetical protein n=1 Tax=Azospirillum sp. TaxID=34012 RepID=UPI003D706E6B